MLQSGHVVVSLVSASSPVPWSANVSWDDLLMVAYDGLAFPDVGNDFIWSFLKNVRTRDYSFRLLLIPYKAAWAAEQ